MFTLESPIPYNAAYFNIHAKDRAVGMVVLFSDLSSVDRIPISSVDNL
jgi:hypothetical protein